MEHKGTGELFSDRLFLRCFELSDADAMFSSWAFDDEVTKYLTWPSHKSVVDTVSVLSSWISCYVRKDYYNWAIGLKESGRIIGNISVVEINEKTDTLQIGYCLGRKYWNHGYMSEALLLVIDFLFSSVKALRLEALHDVENVRSGAVMRRCGMSFEGILRQNGKNNRGIVDCAVYSILRSEWEDKNHAPLMLGNVMVDAIDGEGLCAFYSFLTGWKKCELYGLPAVLSPSGIVFLFASDPDYRPPVWPEKENSMQKQMHFDFKAPEYELAVERALSLGAKKADMQYGKEEWVTFFDPEGHPFCLCRR